MIRIILWRMEATGEWNEGTLHGFHADKAIVETMTNGALQLVPVTPDTLKFKILTKDWIEMQMKAQAEAALQQGAPIMMPPNFRRPGR